MVIAKVACPDERFHNGKIFKTTFSILIGHIFMHICTLLESRLAPKFTLLEEMSCREKIFADIFDHLSYKIYRVLINSMHVGIIYRIYSDLVS
jgi:hypothetical protein